MVLKFILCGENSVGKNTIRERFFGLKFVGQYLKTTGAEFSIKEIIHQDGSTSKAQVWQIASQESFSEVRPLYYQQTHLGLLVYDITVPKTLENVVKWIKDIQATVGIIPVVLIANKIDLRETVPNSVTTAEGSKFARKITLELLKNSFDVPFVELSAKTGQVIPSGGILIKLKEYETNFYLFNS